MDVKYPYVGAYLDSARVGKEHYKVLGLVGGGGFFDGFDIYLAGSVLASMVATRFTTVHLNAAFLSATSLGLLVGTLVAGRIGDIYGRRTTYTYSLLLYGIATVVTAFGSSAWQIITLRGIAGLGLGSVIITGYGMWSEFTPRRYRARWAGVLALAVNISQPASAGLALLVIPQFGWRPMFLIAGIPAIVIWALQMRYLCESPRWLESQGRNTEAFSLARRFNPQTPDYEDVVEFEAPAEAGARLERHVRLRDLFRGRLVPITVLAILISLFTEVAYYSFQAWVPTYLVKDGFSISHTLTFAFIMELGAIPGNLIGGFLADRMGRKWTNVVVFVVLGLLGIGYSYPANTAELMVIGFVWVTVANIMITLTIASYIPEIFPTRVRMQGSALANAFGRGGTILSPIMVSWLFLSFGAPGVFTSSLILLVAAAIAVIILGPETRRKSLESITEENLTASRSATKISKRGWTHA